MFTDAKHAEPVIPLKRRFCLQQFGSGEKKREKEEKLLNLNETFLDGGVQELSGVGDTNLFHHIRPMRFNCFHADFQAVGDFFIF